MAASKKKREKKNVDPFYFDERAATVAVNFFEQMLVHVKGEWARQAFVLEQWQRQIVRDLFGWMRPDGTRKYRTAYIEIPRKNGKSTLAAGLALVLLFVDDEPGAEVYSAAADVKQAAIVFDLAKKMVEYSPVLSKRSQVFKRAIIHPDTWGSYKVLSSEAYTKHGINAHGIIFDELHVQPNRELWDTLTTSTGARRQPLTVAITTSGYDRESICWEVHEYARQVQEKIIQDPTFYPVLYCTDKKEKWTDPKVWKKVNPNLGISKKVDYLKDEFRKAKLTPGYQNTFRRLHLNQWTSQESRWLDIDTWDDCELPVNEKLLEGSVCYGGLDLASTSDLASLLLCFAAESGEDEMYGWLPFFWIPSDNIEERSLKDRVPYDVWARDGFIKATDGNVIDYGIIVKDIEDLGERFDIQEIAFDRWGAFQVVQQLEGAGFTMVGFGQGFVSMAPPTKELLRIILDKKIAHGGHPVLRWMADNMVVKQDPAGNVKPDKSKSREKIDGVVAGIMALDRAMRHEGSGSVYEKRGLVVL